MTNSSVTETEEVVATHLMRATDRTSELLATIGAERERISPEAILDTAEELASSILKELWQARWAMPIDVDPQAMNVSNWPRRSRNHDCS